ncbi:unnamed protein product [Echinostoma caproni]|uniref:LEM domain-containing protein n=1 Tax=Echinostoma caproni TaxID=27848 RepID=A0A183AZ99_9TREM|nr:unnamed protein product [Echinostoma caproni]
MVSSSSQELEKLKSTLMNSYYQDRDRKPSTKGLLTLEHLKRLKELQANRELLLSRPDKDAGSRCQTTRLSPNGGNQTCTADASGGGGGGGGNDDECGAFSSSEFVT